VVGQGSHIRVNGPMLGVASETSGLPDPLTEPAKDKTVLVVLAGSGFVVWLT
jgi:hypothetical protein